MAIKILYLIFTLTFLLSSTEATQQLDKAKILKQLQKIDFASDSQNTTAIETSDPYQFRYVPAGRNGCFTVWVKANNEAHISLSNAAQYINPKIKIIIGGWNNAASAITLNDLVNNPPIKTNTPGILSDQEFRGFWVRWSRSGDILVGKMHELFPFLVYKHTEQWFPINFVGVTCGQTFKGSWIVEDKPNCPF